ncbi:hypothetical protein LCGC14_2690560 [marine sediment metagenome]|uniref:Uncharacterized protein n=1 Tax=marine sediment metagenome TaxID=412755 RepID=A0A0F9CAC7_9ZZZZ
MAENFGGENTTTARQVLRLNVKFDDTDSAGAGVEGTVIDMGSIPANAYPTNIQVFGRTVFNSGTSDVLDIGFGAFGSTSADPNAFTAALDITASGELTVTKLLMGDVQSTTENVPITATWTAVGAAATTGEIEINLEYVQL